MSRLFPSVAKLLSGNTITKATTSPVITSTKTNYSTVNEASFETKPFKLHKLDKGPSTKAKLTSEEALQMYEKLAMIRRIEFAAGNLYKEKAVRGFCHLYSGQEAVAVGMRAVMRDVDSIITAYRCHGWTYLMGVNVTKVLAELTGRQSGVSKGKGGSMHLYTKNFYGGNGIVGAQVPLGAGIAFAHKYKGDGGVNFSLYGDGAANQGQAFEAYNIAKLWDLPCVFICENNGYGMGTSISRSSASTEYYTRGDYVPGIWVDGMDVLATREATRFCIDYCTSGKGPLVMEMETYRYSGHSMSDPGTSYRTRDEIQEVRQTRDPITSFKEKILNAKLVTADQLKDIDTRIRKEVDEATKVAQTDSEPSMEQLTTDIYSHNVEPYIRGAHPEALLPHLQSNCSKTKIADPVIDISCLMSPSDNIAVKDKLKVNATDNIPVNDKSCLSSSGTMTKNVEKYRYYDILLKGLEETQSCTDNPSESSLEQPINISNKTPVANTSGEDLSKKIPKSNEKYRYYDILVKAQEKNLTGISNLCMSSTQETLNKSVTDPRKTAADNTSGKDEK